MASDLIAPAPAPLAPTRPVLAAPIAWGAVFAGVFASLASGLVLTLLAEGVGYTVGFPTLETRASLQAFTPEIGAGAIVIQVLSMGLGGYLVGRLRHVWAELHDDEAHFRDTAHGLIVWAVATVLGALISALVLAPYMASLAPAATTLPASPADLDRAAHVAGQAALFSGIGLLLGGFVAAVAARLGGMQAEHMHAKV